jgi:hypothetical protein
MRNGVYRVWMKGPDRVFASAVVLMDGDVFAVDKRLAFNGRYSECGGRVTADITCTKLIDEAPPAPFPATGSFAMRLQGGAGQEFAQLEASIDGTTVATIECAFLCEV